MRSSMKSHLLKIQVNSSNSFSMIGNFLHIYVKIWKKPIKCIWIGDSHSRYIAGNSALTKRYSLSEHNDLIIWLGPRLLYSISIQGFRLNLFDKMILRRVGSNNLCVFVFGEIDCRVHFVPRKIHHNQEELTRIIQGYKVQVTKLINKYDIDSSFVLTPMPPSDFGSNNPKFPRTGSLIDRVIATKATSNTLNEYSNENFTVVDLSKYLSNSDGSLNLYYSDDGVHVNSLGSSVILKNLKLLKRTLP
jgi:lysophospholipase L1-like esterase